MNIIMLVPKVVSKYVASFPETTNNAYKYFNYDHRVVNERAMRGDSPSTYKGPNEFNDMDYEGLVTAAQQIIDPTLKKYSVSVACDDALNKAVRSYQNGMFDGKVDSSKYNTLLGSLKLKMGMVPKQAKKSEEKPKVEPKPKKDTFVKPNILKQLGLSTSDVPHINKLRKRVREGLTPHLVKERGRIKVKRD